jgi:uncharacterized protein YprB with RNaseH-like and TPR domain
MNAPAAKVLFFDLETAPCLGWTWGMYEQNVIDLKHSWFILSLAYKWQGKKKITVRALPDFKRRDREDDSGLVRELWGLFDEADVVVAHNGDKFDIKKSNARFIKHGLKPPAPYKQIDTLKMARKKFAFVSNRLDDLSAYLKVGRKLPHTGWSMWKRCIEDDDPKAWRMMRRYNAHDVRLLEAVYDRLAPWDSAHPNLSLYSDSPGCPCCTSIKIQRRGFNVARTRRTARFQCTDCGHWWSAGVAA